jgi:hypothetical protein
MSGLLTKGKHMRPFLTFTALDWLALVAALALVVPFARGVVHARSDREVFRSAWAGVAIVAIAVLLSARGW